MNDYLVKYSSSNFLNELFWKTPNPMVISRADDGTYVEVNAAAVKRFGLQMQEIIGRTSVEMGHMSAAQRLMVLHKIKERGYVKDLDLEIKARNNRPPRHVLFNAFPITMGKDAFLLCYVTELSERMSDTDEKRAAILFKSLDAIEGTGVILIREHQLRQPTLCYINEEAQKALNRKPIKELLDALTGHESTYLKTRTGYYHVRKISTNHSSPLQIVLMERLSDKVYIKKKLKQHNLTPRQEEIALLAVTGHSNSEIAEKLFISEYTVKDHLKEIFRKIGIRNRSELYPRILNWR